MAGIYKFGVPSDTDYDKAISECVQKVSADDSDPIVERGLFWTPEHTKSNEYIVKIVTRAED